jgi:hypothetical protein
MSKIKWYIAGSIDKNPDFGKGSRALIRDMLDEMGLDYFCPALTEANRRNMEKKESLWDLMASKGPDRWKEALAERVKPLVDDDMEGLRECTGVIVLLDQYIGCGTASECTVGKERGLPIVGLFLPGVQPLKVAPWTLTRINEFCETTDELREVLLRYERND